MSTMEEVLARLNPKTAAAFRVASDIKHEVLPTPSLGVNIAMGGLGYGRFVVLYGNRGSGKTMFALQCVAEAQRRGGSALWLDVEKNFEHEWAQRLGVNTDSLLVDDKTISIAGMADKGLQAITAGIDVLVIDSISQLLPQSYFEDAKNGKETIKGLAQTGQIGTFSKNMGQAINMLNSVNDKTLIILISQVRNQIGSWGASISFMGGKAVEHAASTVIKMWRVPSDIITKEVHVGEGLLLERPVGSPITWTIEKNRGPGMGQSNTYNIFNVGEEIGVDLIGEIVTYGVEYGVIKKSGNWHSYGENGKQYNGAAAFADHLRGNPDLKDTIYGEILAKSI